ncbi:Hypothetical protein CJM1_1335 [Campylobacter jejuni subsp. jejuni M1]|nr:Hypothetical protein CJM1_1335 [Campylobacter jejuni subsp. jejuni M1]
MKNFLKYIAIIVLIYALYIGLETWFS